MIELQERHSRNPERVDGEGGIAAFESFFRAHYRPILQLAQRVVGDTQRAQDVTQEVFLAAYRRFPGEYEQAAGWIRVAAVHTALNLIRSERRRGERELRLPAVPQAPGIEEAVIDRERRAQVRRVLCRLPQRTAAVLILRHAGMSYIEIAAAVGVKVSHVGTLLRRAEAAFRKEMDRETHR